MHLSPMKPKLVVFGCPEYREDERQINHAWMGLVEQLLSGMNKMARTNEYAVAVSATDEARRTLQVELEDN